MTELVSSKDSTAPRIRLGEDSAMTTATNDTASIATPLPAFRSRFRDRGHPLLAAAAYVIAALIGLASLPVLFVVTDHNLVVEWINAVFDLAGI
jgi:hypothetical protein